MENQDGWWFHRRGAGPVVATAIHDGHHVGKAALAEMSLDDAERLREEDPFTGEALKDLPTYTVACRSRFEIDLNRARNTAIYRKPEQSWGLRVWQTEPSDAVCQEALAYYDAYYAHIAAVLDSVASRHDKFVLLDVHSYNHRRGGANAAPTPQEEAPDINIGTISMPRAEWGFLLDPLMDAMRNYDFAGRKLDVRENVAFEGRGEQTRFVHDRYPGRACAIALEFKKFYMDEWTGEPDHRALSAMRGLLTHVAQTAKTVLERG
ncbi:N-formylglutamate amidohydrolase [Altererythrobacter sp. H2]|uniref:N-formylglutamate amidohydrolase n=1 Tax=Altererythrobacter sp. H2 TaxID=3108391 RepID=UPI002B4BCF7A|nr:N-formylglutamate amidohydrolase [Altererythrobacter sp. H2]WRK95229.1 N-formylglutamate amidohydrolase [Altererythrobacter sp. H2]